MLSHSIPFSPERDIEAFAQIPSAPGVFLLRGYDKHSETYVTKSADLKRRIMRLLAPPESQTKRLNLRERCASIEFTATGSEFENLILLYRLLRQVFPETYAKRMRLNLAPLIRIHWENAYPRAYITRKLSGISGKKPEQYSPGGKSVYFGPFRSRALAEKYLNDSLDLFKSRRCTFELHPDPVFPGCVYSEMKMCLAPCFKGCTDQEYVEEMRRVQRFFETRGESLVQEVEAEREKASSGMDFETAAGHHARVEKIQGVVKGCDDFIRRLDTLDALVMQPSPDAGCISLFRFVQGQFLGPLPFTVQGMLPSNEKSGSTSLYAQPFMAESKPISGASVTARSKPVSLETRLADVLEGFEPAPKISEGSYGEQLALLKRWYYRTTRVGEIFLRDRNGEWPMRKMVRGMSRVLVGGTSEAASSTS